MSSLGVEAPGLAKFFQYDAGHTRPGQVRLDTCFTGLSASTELVLLKHTNPYLTASWNAEAGTFHDGAPAMQFLVQFPGYLVVGRQIEAQATGFAIGDVVTRNWDHKTGQMAHGTDDLIVPLPADMDPMLVVFCRTEKGPIAANALRLADALAH